jgi:hypothetical protein
MIARQQATTQSSGWQCRQRKMEQAIVNRVEGVQGGEGGGIIIIQGRRD